MKTFIAILATLLFTIVLFGQAAGPSGSSFSFLSSTGTCDLPAPGKTILCGTGSTVLISVNGSAFTDTKGAPGPQGPPGTSTPAPSSFSCSNLQITSTGISGSNCSFK